MIDLTAKARAVRVIEFSLTRWRVPACGLDAKLTSATVKSPARGHSLVLRFARSAGFIPWNPEVEGVKCRPIETPSRASSRADPTLDGYARDLGLFAPGPRRDAAGDRAVTHGPGHRRRWHPHLARLLRALMQACAGVDGNAPAS
jgi:hypothetical protein